MYKEVKNTEVVTQGQIFALNWVLIHDLAPPLKDVQWVLVLRVREDNIIHMVNYTQAFVNLNGKSKDTREQYIFD